MSKNTVTTQEAEKLLRKPTFSGGEVCSQIRFLTGEILTIIDASYQDKEQKKAIKDLVRNAVASKLGYITELALEGKSMKITDEQLEEAVEMDLEEVL